MPKKPPPESALFVRLPAEAREKLDRAAQALGMRKKDLVAGLVTKYVDPDSPRALGALTAPRLPLERGDAGLTRGSYSFQPYDPPPDLPEVLTADQAADLLQIDEATVVSLAEAGKLPGRKLGAVWRFSRAGLLGWLAAPAPEKR